jgi:hypothetical protein
MSILKDPIVAFTSVRCSTFRQPFSFKRMSLFPFNLKGLIKSTHSTSLTVNLNDELSRNLKVQRTVLLSTCLLTGGNIAFLSV